MRDDPEPAKTSKKYRKKEEASLQAGQKEAKNKISTRNWKTPTTQTN
jgi:hypothetical protein